MENPLQITYHDVQHNAEVDTLIKEKFQKVLSENPFVTKCHVTINKQSKHHQKGNEASVRLDLKISRFDDIVVTEKCIEDTAAIKSAVIRVFKQSIDLAREAKKHRKEQRRVAQELPAEAVETAEE